MPFDYADHLGPQDRRAKGHRRDVHPPRHAARAAVARRLAGPRAPARAPRTSRWPSASRARRSWRSRSARQEWRSARRHCATRWRRRSCADSRRADPRARRATCPAHRQHLGPGHGQRVDADGARPQGRGVLRGVGVSERERRVRRTCWRRSASRPSSRRAAIRMSLGSLTTRERIDRVAELFPRAHRQGAGVAPALVAHQS